jgi:hypothetical protein
LTRGERDTSLGGVARVIHACERCGSIELDEYWELTPFELPRAAPEPLFIERFVQECCACGHAHREHDGRVCVRKDAPANARIVRAPARTST